MSPDDLEHLEDLEEGLGSGLRRAAGVARSAAGRVPWNKGRKNFNWKEWQHKRDRNGRFVDMPGKLVKSVLSMRHGEWRDLHELVEMVNAIRSENQGKEEHRVTKALVFKHGSGPDAMWEFRWTNQENRPLGIRINAQDFVDADGNNDPERFLDKIIKLMADLEPDDMDDWIAEGKTLCPCGCRNWSPYNDFLPGHKMRKGGSSAVEKVDDLGSMGIGANKTKKSLYEILGISFPKIPKKTDDNDDDDGPKKWGLRQRLRGFDANGNPIPEASYGDILKIEKNRWAVLFGRGDVNKGKKLQSQKKEYERKLDNWVSKVRDDYKKKHNGETPDIHDIFSPAWRRANNVGDPPSPSITDGFLDDDDELNDKWGRTPKKISKRAQELSKKTGRTHYVYIDPTKIKTYPNPDGESADIVDWDDEDLYIISDRLHWDDDKGVGDYGEWVPDGDGNLRPNYNSPAMADGMLLIRQVVGRDGDVYEINARKSLNKNNLGTEFYDMKPEDLKTAFAVQDAEEVAQKLSQLRIDAANFQRFSGVDDGLYIDPRTDTMAKKIFDHIDGKATIKSADVLDYKEDYNPLGVNLNKVTLRKRNPSSPDTTDNDSPKPNTTKHQLAGQIFEQKQKEVVQDIVAGKNPGKDGERPFALLERLVQQMREANKKNSRRFHNWYQLQMEHNWEDADPDYDLPSGTKNRERSMYKRWRVTTDGRFAMGLNSLGLWDVFFRPSGRGNWSKSTNVKTDVKYESVYNTVSRMAIREDIHQLRMKFDKVYDFSLEGKPPGVQGKLDRAYERFWDKLEQDAMQRVRENKKMLTPNPGGSGGRKNLSSVIRDGDTDVPGSIPGDEDILPSKVASSKDAPSQTDPNVKSKNVDGAREYDTPDDFDKIEFEEVKVDPEPEAPKKDESRDYDRFYIQTNDDHEYFDREEIVTEENGEQSLIIRAFRRNKATGEEAEIEMMGIPLTKEMLESPKKKRQALSKARSAMRRIVEEDDKYRRGDKSGPDINNDIDRADADDLVASSVDSINGRREVRDELEMEWQESTAQRADDALDGEAQELVNQIEEQVARKEEARKQLADIADDDQQWGIQIDRMAEEIGYREVDGFEYDRPKNVKTNNFGIQEGVELWVTPSGGEYRLDYDTDKEKYRLWYTPDSGDEMLLDDNIGRNKHSLYTHNKHVEDIIESHHKGDFDPANNRIEEDLPVEEVSPSAYNIDKPDRRVGKDVVMEGEDDDFFYRHFGTPDEEDAVDIDLIHVDRDGNESTVKTYGGVKPDKFADLDEQMRQDAADKSTRSYGAGQWRGNWEGAAVHRMRDMDGNEWRIAFHDEQKDADGLTMRRGELVKVTPDGRKETVGEFNIPVEDDPVRNELAKEKGFKILSDLALKAQLNDRLTANREEMKELIDRPTPYRGRAPHGRGDLLYAKPDGSYRYAMQVGGYEDKDGVEHKLYSTFDLVPDGKGDYDVVMVGRRADFKEGEDRDSFIRGLFGDDIDIDAPTLTRKADVPESKSRPGEDRLENLHKRASDEISLLENMRDNGIDIESVHIYEDEKGGIWTVRGDSVIGPDGKTTNMDSRDLVENVDGLSPVWNNNDGFLDADLQALHNAKLDEVKKDMAVSAGSKPSFAPTKAAGAPIKRVDPTDQGWEKLDDKGVFSKGDFLLRKEGANWVVVRKGEAKPLAGGPTQAKALERFDALDLDKPEAPDAPDTPEVRKMIPLNRENHPALNSDTAWEKIADAIGEVDEAGPDARGLYVWYDAYDDGNGRPGGWVIGKDIPEGQGIRPLAYVPPYDKKGRGAAVDIRPVRFPDEDKLFFDSLPERMRNPETGKPEFDVGRIAEKHDDWGKGRQGVELPGPSAKQIADQLAQWDREAQRVSQSREAIADAFDPDGSARRSASKPKFASNTDALSKAVLHTKSKGEFFDSENYDDWDEWNPTSREVWKGADIDGIFDYKIGYDPNTKKYTLQLIDRDGTKRVLEMHNKPSHEWMQQQFDWYGKGMASPLPGDLNKVVDDPKGWGSARHIEEADYEIAFHGSMPVRMYQVGNSKEEALAFINRDGWVFDEDRNVLEKVSGPEVDALQRIGDDYRHEYSDLIGADVPNSFDGKVRVIDSDFSSHMMVADEPRLYELGGKWYLRSNTSESGRFVDGYGQPAQRSVGLLAMSMQPGEKHKLYFDFRGLSQAPWFTDADSPGKKTGLRRVVGHEIAHAYSIGRMETNDSRMRVIETDLGFEEGLVEVFAAVGAQSVSKRQGVLGDFKYNSAKDFIDDIAGIGPNADQRMSSPYKTKIQFLEFARFLAKADLEPFYRTLMNSDPLQRREALLRIIDVSGKQRGLPDDEIVRNKRMITRLIDNGYMSGINVANNQDRLSLWSDARQEWRISNIFDIADDLRTFGITERYHQIMRSYV